MTTFEYRGYDISGHPRNGLIEAMDPKDARKRLTAQGILAETLQAAEGAAARRIGRSPSGRHRTLFYRGLPPCSSGLRWSRPGGDPAAPELDHRARCWPRSATIYEDRPLSAPWRRLNG